MRYARFAKQHPVLHKANVVISLLLPTILITAFLLLCKPADFLPFFLLQGLVFSFAFGLSLFLCAIGFYSRESIADVLPLFLFALVGCGYIIFCACSSLVRENLNHTLAYFQFLSFCSTIWFCVIYANFREAMTAYIQRKTHISDKTFDTYQSGFFPSLWYQNIHKKFSLGKIYYANIGITLFLLFFHLANELLAVYASLARAVLFFGIFSIPLTILCTVFTCITDEPVYQKAKRAKRSVAFYKKIPYFYEIGCVGFQLGLAWLQYNAYNSLF